VISTVRDAKVIWLTEVERIGANKSGLAGRWSEQNGQLAGDVAVAGMGCRCHVVRPLPHLVEGVNPELLAPLNELLECGRSRPEHHRLHIADRTGLPDQPTAVSLLDRLCHHAHIITTTGDSYRLRHRTTGRKET
jgi:IstB-like ATP binding protein